MITANVGATSRALRGLSEAIATAAISTVKDTVAAIEQHAQHTRLFNDGPDKTTRDSIRGEAHGLIGFVQAGGSAGFLEWGTRPHRIVAKGKALRFTVAGETIYRKWVQHPGTKPRPFMQEAARHGEEVAVVAAEYHFARIT